MGYTWLHCPRLLKGVSGGKARGLVQRHVPLSGVGAEGLEMVREQRVRQPNSQTDPTEAGESQ